MRGGFTLLEVVIASGIALVVGTLMLSILTTNTGVFYKQRSTVTTGLNLNDAIADVTDTIKQGSFVAAGYPEGSPTYTTSDSALVIKLSAYNSSGVIADTYDFAIVTRDLAKPQLLKLLIFTDPSSQRKSVSKILTNILDSIKFKYMDSSGSLVTPSLARQIEVSITTTSSIGQVGSKRTAVTTASLNNLQN